MKIDLDFILQCITDDKRKVKIFYSNGKIKIRTLPIILIKYHLSKGRLIEWL